VTVFGCVSLLALFAYLLYALIKPERFWPLHRGMPHVRHRLRDGGGALFRLHRLPCHRPGPDL